MTKEWSPAGRPPLEASRLERALEEADLAFWTVIAKAFPRVKSGDLPPLTVDRFRHHQRDVVLEWLSWNLPERDWERLKAWLERPRDE